MIRLLASDLAYPAVAQAAQMIALLTNAHCHADLREMPEAERLALLAEWTSVFEELEH